MRKITSILTAFLLSASLMMPYTAYADELVISEIQIGVEKDGTGNTYEITITPVEDAPDPDKDIVRIREGESTTVYVTTAEPGVFEYKVQESQTENSDKLTTDTSVYSVLVCVTYSGDDLVSSVIAQKNTSNEKPESIVFVNTPIREEQEEDPGKSTPPEETPKDGGKSGSGKTTEKPKKLTEIIKEAITPLAGPVKTGDTRAIIAWTLTFICALALLVFGARSLRKKKR